MPATVVERYGSRLEASGDTAQATRLFVIFGATDAADAMSAMAAHADSFSYAGIPRVRFELTDQINNETWYAVCEYSTATADNGAADTPAELPTPYPSISFTSGGGTEHIQSSRQIVDSAGDPFTDAGNAINFDGENVNGLDILVPSFDFEITRYYVGGTVNTVAIALMTGSVNNATFEGFDAGSVLFKSAQGRRKLINGVEGMWEISFQFSMLPNRTGIVIGGFAAVDKKGWEYLEILYETGEDSGNQKQVKKPLGVIVHQVYDYSDFSSLPI